MMVLGLVVLLGAVIAAAMLRDMWLHDGPGAVMAGLGVATGGALCWSTAMGYEFTAVLPELGGVSRGWGYAAGVGIVAVGFIIGVFSDGPSARDGGGS